MSVNTVVMCFNKLYYFIFFVILLLPANTLINNKADWANIICPSGCDLDFSPFDPECNPKHGLGMGYTCVKCGQFMAILKWWKMNRQCLDINPALRWAHNVNNDDIRWQKFYSMIMNSDNWPQLVLLLFLHLVCDNPWCLWRHLDAVHDKFASFCHRLACRFTLTTHESFTG